MLVNTRMKAQASVAGGSLPWAVWTSVRWALPSRAVPVLDGRGRLERATRCGVGAGSGAGKSARRFPAASSDPVIRVDPKRPPAHQCA